MTKARAHEAPPALPGVDEWSGRLAAIESEPDVIQRNRDITALYHDLSVAMAGFVGEPDANWLTFGKWASYTAGRFLRGEDIPVRAGADDVARGNLAIIADIAPAFIAFLVGEGVIEGAPDHALVVRGRDRIATSAELRDAFWCYSQARLLPSDPADARRAQLILRGNIRTAFHEQAFADDLIDSAMPLGGFFGIITARFVRLHLPGAVLDVAEPLAPPQYLGGAMWPSALRVIDDPGILDIHARIGHDAGDSRQAAARSWEDFDERMGYIASFFRAYQRDSSLHAAPPD